MYSVKKTSILLFVSLLFVLTSLLGCSSSSNSGEAYGRVTGSLPEAANSNIVAKSDTAVYLIAVDSMGRFSAHLPAAVYTFSFRGAFKDGKLSLTNKTVVVANNTTINIVDADLVPQPKVLAVSVPVINANSAIIEWETDIESDGYLEYGTNELYGISTQVSTDLTLRHRVQLDSLISGTTYHFRIIASRYSLESAKFISRDYTFTTKP